MSDRRRPRALLHAALVSNLLAFGALASMPAAARAAGDGTNADAYNWLAYAIRKNGDPARSIAVYQKALGLDPKHREAHEYLGEAYLALGNVTKARAHLTKLDSLCFFPCSEYRHLKNAVETYEKSGGKVKPTAGR